MTDLVKTVEEVYMRILKIHEEERSVQNETKRKHMVKKKQKLSSSSQTLSFASVGFLYQYCEASYASPNTKPLAALIQIMLFTGRTHEDILASLSEENKASERQLRLYNGWEFPAQQYRQDINLNSKSRYIVLPNKFSACLSLKVKNTPDLCIGNELRKFLSRNDELPAECFTLPRIRSVLSHYREVADLSEYDISFISNSDLYKEPHSYYGQVSRASIQAKFDKFVSILDVNSLCFNESLSQSDGELIGCNYDLAPSNIRILFDGLAQDVKKSRSSSRKRLLHTYNALTKFVVSYLMLSSLHRPSRGPFNKLTSFNLALSEVTIQDKGPESLRTIPLCKSAVVMLDNYLRYRRQLSFVLSRQVDSSSNELLKGLNSESDLFMLIDVNNKATKRYIPSDVLKDFGLNDVLQNNYSRHYFATLLNQKGVSRDDIRLLMGHKLSAVPDLEYSSTNFNILHEMIAILDEHLCTEVSQGGLGISIPEFVL